MPLNLDKRWVISLGVLFAFLVNTFGPIPSAQAQDFLLPAPGVMVPLSPEFNPPILKGIKVHPENPFKFDFILDKGDSQLSNDALKNESKKLIKYFLASLTIPEKDLWVNLSPYEKDRIVPQSFGHTEMGRDLLAEDYMLKQITASLIYPEGETGKKFWKRIYKEAEKKFGTTNIPVNTFNKVWIVPEKAVVYENAKIGAAYVVESKLKVMLEQDYLSLAKHEGIQSSQARIKVTNQLGSQVVREIVIPELTKEINEDKNFAPLRQVYNSLILATWYKNKIKDSILAQVYANKNKVAGVNIDDPQEKERIYQRYLQAFKKGVYNYIKEEIDPTTQETVPKKYFSGGFDLDMSMLHAETEAPQMPIQAQGLDLAVAEISPFSKTVSIAARANVAGRSSSQSHSKAPYLAPVPLLQTSTIGFYRSYLGRHYSQWEYLRNRVLPYLITRALERRRHTHAVRARLVVADVGASTGEEMARAFYEIMAALTSHGQDPNNWDIVIRGIDASREIITEARRRINNQYPFNRSLIEQEQSRMKDGRYYADHIIATLNKYPTKFRKSTKFIEKGILDVTSEDLADVDLVLLNHVLRIYRKEIYKRWEIVKKISEASPEAVIAIGDLRDIRYVWWKVGGLQHRFSVNVYNPDKTGTSYFIGLPPDVARAVIGDTAMRSVSKEIAQPKQTTSFLSFPKIMQQESHGKKVIRVADLGAESDDFLEEITPVLTEAGFDPELTAVDNAWGVRSSGFVGHHITKISADLTREEGRAKLEKYDLLFLNASDGGIIPSHVIDLVENHLDENGMLIFRTFWDGVSSSLENPLIRALKFKKIPFIRLNQRFAGLPTGKEFQSLRPAIVIKKKGEHFSKDIWLSEWRADEGDEAMTMIEKDERLADGTRSISHNAKILSVAIWSDIRQHVEVMELSLDQKRRREISKIVDKHETEVLALHSVIGEQQENSSLKFQKEYQERVLLSMQRTIKALKAVEFDVNKYFEEHPELRSKVIREDENAFFDFEKQIKLHVSQITGRIDRINGERGNELIQIADLRSELEELFPSQRTQLTRVRFNITPDIEDQVIRGSKWNMICAVYNLINNSLEADRSGNRVDVNISRTPKGEALIEVRDQGPGIPQNLLEYDDSGRLKIFDPNATTKGNGTGLGTNDAWYFAKDMGGEISVKNIIKQGSVKGASFIIKFPLDRAMKVAEKRPDGPGGIDLTPADKVLQTQNGGIGIKFHISPAQLAQWQDAPGVMIESISIRPLKSLSAFLGLPNNQPTHQAVSL